MPKPDRRQATWAPWWAQIQDQTFRSPMFGGVNGDFNSITHPWDLRNFTQNCLKTPFHTSLRVSYCV